MGFDAHRFADSGSDRPCALACLQWPGVGLEGDSDGDVVAHAVVDAVLSAALIGDIGSLVGVGKGSLGSGASGSDILRRCVDVVSSRGLRIESVSAVIIGNRPKVGPRRVEAQTAMSQAVGCPVSLTATTTDAMGFTGRGEGVAAMATAVVRDMR